MGEGIFANTQEMNQEGVKFILQGRLDSNHLDELGHKLTNALETGHVNIVLNMHHVEYLCSSGIRVILKAYKEARSVGGKLEIEMPSDCVKNILTMVALDAMLIK